MILDRILEHKKAEVRHKQSRGYLVELKSRIRDRGATRGFMQALKATRPPNSPSLIAEVKKASPSLGLLRPEFKDLFEPVKIAEQYKEHGASALSVLTDKDFFQGELDYLQAIKDKVGLPCLNKEFMVDDIQFYEARAYGADAVLLIVAALERRQLIDFFALAQELSLDVLIETHHERELDTVLERLPDARLIGINNRDLKTFSTDLGVTERLAKRIPTGKVIVSESGIHKRDDVKRVMGAGCQAMLIGESLIRADDTGKKIRELLGMLQKVEG
ncbi:MAG: indole-3-glycerol phosphate synthase TrpC [Nitrospirota bacterium]|nr:indole-3-glycerol phosphate synthase TrpC [Nitrospirota bacterium]MDE3034627.1 indole-3-glycerol phosphate synthase TrpC [Nitrospirota bacterium]MDE3225042.1 indole-3-glycerol phosphate synthase TrpC [Nitrospirota bacterium]MDE3242407.1 indole-3-glycerol phosphate synthase TrpC [Nitrospirota bacterium]